MGKDKKGEPSEFQPQNNKWQRSYRKKMWNLALRHMFVHQQRLLIPFLSDIMSYHTEQSLSPSAHNVSHSHTKYTTPSVTKHAQLQRSHPSQSLHHKQRKINHPIKTKTTHSSTYLSYGTKSKFTTRTLSASHLC